MSDRFDHTLEHKLETKPDEAAGTDVRRIEVITGVMPEACCARGRRRQWSSEARIRILVESFRPGANVSEVARRHGMSPQQLFAWRREARAMFETQPLCPAEAPLRRASVTAQACEPTPAFAQVVVAAPTGSPPSAPMAKASGTIEIVIGDCVVRVVGPVNTDAITTVLQAIRRAS